MEVTVFILILDNEEIFLMGDDLMRIVTSTLINPFLLSRIAKYFNTPMENALESLSSLAELDMIFDHDIEKVVGKDDYLLSFTATKLVFDTCGEGMWTSPGGFSEFCEDIQIYYEDENMASEEPYHAFTFFLATENYRKARGKDQTHSENSEDKIEVVGSEEMK